MAPKRKVKGSSEAEAKVASNGTATTTAADASKPKVEDSAANQEGEEGRSSGSQKKQYWLMKAEPDPRLEKGIDVAFSIDHFERAKDQTTSWDGVRNPEARSMMRDRMRRGDKVLFYHSNCKLPGIAGIATIARQGYPDHTAWDPKHPYFDPKSTDKENPKWYMVDVKLERRLQHLVPLALLQQLAAGGQEEKLEYMDDQDIEAIAKMQLLNRGRLSVQSVEERAFEAIVRLGDKGEWTEWPGKWNPTRASSKGQVQKKSKTETPKGEKKDKGAVDDGREPTEPARRSKRAKK